MRATHILYNLKQTFEEREANTWLEITLKLRNFSLSNSWEKCGNLDQIWRNFQKNSIFLKLLLNFYRKFDSQKKKVCEPLMHTIGSYTLCEGIYRLEFYYPNSKHLKWLTNYIAYKQLISYIHIYLNLEFLNQFSTSNKSKLL
jgi:hypothetical protein